MLPWHQSSETGVFTLAPLAPTNGSGRFHSKPSRSKRGKHPLKASLKGPTSCRLASGTSGAQTRRSAPQHRRSSRPPSRRRAGRGPWRPQFVFFFFFSFFFSMVFQLDLQGVLFSGSGGPERFGARRWRGVKFRSCCAAAEC